VKTERRTGKSHYVTKGDIRARGAMLIDSEDIQLKLGTKNIKEKKKSSTKRRSHYGGKQLRKE